MAKQIVTRATLARRTPFRCASNASHRQILGPILLSKMESGKFLVDYCTKAVGCAVAIVESDDDATIQRAIDKWIDDTNYGIESDLRRRAEDVRAHGNDKRAAELHADAEDVRAKRLAYRAARAA